MAVPLVAVGEVLKPHGVAGVVKVRALTDRPRERFDGLLDCVLWEPASDRREACRIGACRFDGDTVLVKVEGVDSPEGARRLSGWLLAVERAQVLPAPDGAFYPWEMEGARVETPDGRPVGSFVGVENAGAQDLWVIAAGGKQHLVPAVPEIVIDVSVAERRIVIDPPPGLFDL